MGLSGRKVKQRISADPRNLGWADDAARFGSNYLSKFGWDASKGLGASGDGMKSHIKVSHKLDMLGIGAAQTKDPNGIAWKQNRDFENLLQRLNEKLEVEQMTAAEKKEESAAEGKVDSEDGEKKKKKRKHKETEEEDGSERKKKKNGKDRKEGDGEESCSKAEAMQVDTAVETKTAVEVQKVVALPRHRAHRARLIAAKNISSKSAAHISEILGIAPSPQTKVNSVEVPGKPTTVTETDALGMDKLTTSTKSLADYFKEKLNTRMGSSSGTSTPTAARADADDAYDAPRGGIGASRMHLEIQSETKIEEETQRVGLSKFSSLMSSSFLAATSSISYVPTQTEQDEEPLDEVEGVVDISDVDSDTETKEKSKKEKKRKEKKRSKGTSEDEDDKVERKEKKSKKDKKGKGKATEEVEEDVDVDAREDEKKGRKKDKKEKKKRAIEAAPKAEATEDDVEVPSRKKEKKKHKLEKSEATSAEPEDSSKSKKEKKRHRTDSD